MQRCFEEFALKRLQIQVSTGILTSEAKLKIGIAYLRNHLCGWLFHASHALNVKETLPLAISFITKYTYDLLTWAFSFSTIQYENSQWMCSSPFRFSEMQPGTLRIAVALVSVSLIHFEIILKKDEEFKLPRHDWIWWGVLKSESNLTISKFPTPKTRAQYEFKSCFLFCYNIKPLNLIRLYSRISSRPNSDIL